ncbi:class D beta-lactamase [Rhizobium terrae]|uniref:class D beta-lactamase n=1 Tax=Rhizobium terrae TaxID=2171756 RepID=UPI000E3E0E14|nr:class D beta-lactamase [Rhizobium terrae]
MVFRNSLLLAGLLGLAATFLDCVSARAADPIRCTVIIDEQSGDTLYREGTCDQGFYPQSTFKLPLAMMGYDAGILTDAQNPRWKYQAKFGGPERVKKDVDPLIWEKDSIVWYSQELTRKLGAKAFADYVKRFGYGNTDVSGGLMEAWLMSSLKISADQQVQFIRRFLTGRLPISENAVDMTLAVIPHFPAADGWDIQGKTGSGWLRDKAGKTDYDRPLGWFVGWAMKDDRRVIFARLLVDTKRYKGDPISFVVRDGLIKDFPKLVEGF